MHKKIDWYGDETRLITLPIDGTEEQRNVYFQKIVIVGDHSPRYQNEDGILFMDIYDFMMDERSVVIWEVSAIHI